MVVPNSCHHSNNGHSRKNACGGSYQCSAMNIATSSSKKRPKDCRCQCNECEGRYHSSLDRNLKYPVLCGLHLTRIEEPCHAGSVLTQPNSKWLGDNCLNCSSHAIFVGQA